MASTNEPEPVQLQLTEVESKLRQLLLDVAAYIDSNASPDDVSVAQLPPDLASEKVVLRWTGGWVRDKLLRTGSHDIDLAINKMTGEHFGLKMQEYLQIPGKAELHGLVEANNGLDAHDKAKKIAPGLHKIEANPEKSKNLETATTKIMGIDLDLVNLRKETYNEVSRNPQMEFGTAEEDAMRRDATVNAMFYNLHTCQVEDFTKRGHEDMAAKIIRTPLEPYQTFKDDPLRVLRLIRFASRLNYTIEADTANAMGNQEIQDVLKIKISRERVGIELEKMLKGPRPRMALELIDRFGLYTTVFTDPTRTLPADPETAYFHQAYDFVESIVKCTDEIPTVISDVLLRDDEERYLAWVCAAVMPWVDAPTVPHPKPAQRPFYPAYLVAREGFKAPNRVCDVVTAALSHGEEIRRLVAQCAKALRRQGTAEIVNDHTARDTLGMAVRRWGATWRAQLFFNLTYEVVLNQVSKEGLLESYMIFLKHLMKLEILDADTFRPLLKGTDLAKALGTKPGPWMKDALDVVMAWQLRHPETTDPTYAIEAVRASRSEKNDSELSSRLAFHFLKLTIPPFFPQNEPKTSALEASRQRVPWKDGGSKHMFELLEWVISVLERKQIEEAWHFMVPPILKVADDMDVKWKVEGCRLLRSLLNRVRLSGVKDVSTNKRPTGQNSGDFLMRTGYHNVFAETLFPMLAYIPSITPEKDSVALFTELLPALTSLSLLLPVEAGTRTNKNAFLDRMLRDGIYSPIAHFPTPSMYPELATTILAHLPIILDNMGIDSVKHLHILIPLLCSNLQEPFVMSHEPLLMTSLKALQAVMRNSWPRIAGYRCEILMGLCLLWGRCIEENKKKDDKEVKPVEEVIRDLVAMLDAIMGAAEGDKTKSEWKQEKAKVVEASSGHKAMFKDFES